MSDTASSASIAYSVVAPAFNESANLPTLVARLRDVLTKLCGDAWELLIVDDGSSDDTWAVIQRLATAEPQVRGLRFSRNFGHHVAISAGLDHARGARVVVMDADLQHRPEDLPRFAAVLDQGADVAYGLAERRAHGFLKRALSWAFVQLINRFGGAAVEINSSLFRMMRRPVVEAVKSCRERDRYVVGLMSWVGFTQVGVPITYDARLAGAPKYSLTKSLLLAVTTIISFSTAPLRLATFLGLAFSALAFVLAVQIVVQKIFYRVAVSGFASLFAGLMLLGGVTLLVLGVVGEYIGHVVSEVKARPLYIVRESVGGAENEV